jgi:drug/metabolite transporter (DMT)-like permease
MKKIVTHNNDWWMYFEKLTGISQDTQYAILLSVLSALLTALGLVLIKYAHNHYFIKYKTHLANPITNFWWSFGLFVTTTGTLVYIPALSFGNQILLASSCSLSIIFNLFFAVSILKERILPSDIVGIMMICVGSVVFLYFAKN